MSSPGFQHKIRAGAKKFEFQAEVGFKGVQKRGLGSVT